MAKDKSMVKRDAATPALPRVEEEWEKALREQARNERSNETLGVPRVTHKGSLLAVDGQKVADRVIRIVPLGYVAVKEWYKERYEEGRRDTPACYAFGTSDKGLTPHAVAPEKQDSNCDTCRWNRFGTAERGRGKACADRRRILFLLADDLQKRGEQEVAEAIAKAQHYQISVPPASLRAFGQYLASLGDLTPHGNIREAITEIGTEPRDSGGHSLTFRFLDVVPASAMPALMKRGQGAFELLAQPYPVIEQEPVEAPRQVKGQQKRR